MSSDNNVDNKDTLTNQEDIFYKKTTELLHSNFHDKDGDNLVEVLEVLRDIFTDFEQMNPQLDGNFKNDLKENSFGVLNYEKIFGQSTHKQLTELFACLCITHNISDDDYAQMQNLFYFVSGALIHSRKNEKIKLTWNHFVEYLNLDVLVRTYHVRTDFPEELRQKLLRYLKTLPHFNLTNSSQENLTYENHFLWTSKMKSVFYFSDEREITNNENLMRTINEIMNFSEPGSEHVPSLRTYVSNLFYDGLVNEEQVQEIDENLSHFIENNVYITCGQVYFNLVDSLIRKDQASFFNATDEYLEIYWKGVKFSPSISGLKTEEFKLEQITLEDKIVAFFTNYFENVQVHTEPMQRRFMDLMMAYYDRDLFENFMQRYNIPYNVPIREEHLLKLEKEQQLVTQHYFSLFELAVYQEKYNIASDLLSKPQILESFYAKIIEGKTVYEYHYEAFSDLTYMNEQALFYLIEKGIFDHKTLLPIEQANEVTYMADLFYYALHNGYDQAFLKLYYKSKAENALFNLKDYQRNTTLFCIYLILMKRNPTDLVNPGILSVFANEGYSLYEKNVDGYSAADFIKELPVKMATHITVVMESLFEREQALALSIVNDKVSTSPFLSKEHVDQQIEWFNRGALEEHFKRLGKEKDSANMEYIKTMLSDSNHLRKNLLVQDETFFDTLMTKFPNFEEVIKFYRGQFRLKKLTGKIHIPPILLLGEPGIGKTHFAKEFSQFLNTGYTFLDMGSLTANWVLSGNNGTWKSAKQGKILESLMKSKTINPIILMDELDKARGGDFDPTLVLYQLLEEVNAKEFTDEFVDFTFNASGVIYIACANSIQNISDPLLSRFKVFNIQKPTDSQLTGIIHNIYTEATKMTNLFSETIEESLLKKLKTHSLRGIKVIIEDAISNALLECTPSEITEKLENSERISLTANHLKDPQKKVMMGFNQK